MKKLLFVIFTLLLVIGCSNKNPKEYGVFLGINENEINKLDDYMIVVIEPTEFSKEEIQTLKNKGKTVYGYLNIGSIETYRPYYIEFNDITLDEYENWKDEYWIDVTSLKWQNFIINEIGKDYVDMGFDGLFIDNTDIYYHYQNKEVFNSIYNILKGLKSYDIKLIINGGDLFVSKCIDTNIAKSLFDAINQETVFTSIDFENKEYGLQLIEETEYFKEYLNKVKEYGLPIFLIEYNPNKSLIQIIDNYCHENGFIWYNADSIDLK